MLQSLWGARGNIRRKPSAWMSIAANEELIFRLDIYHFIMSICLFKFSRNFGRMNCTDRAHFLIIEHLQLTL